MTRRLDRDARVLVFIDGQNVYKACERLYGQGTCHPLLMADYDYTHQLRHEDFEAASDSFNYEQPVPQDLQDRFVDDCGQIRGHFP